METQQKQVSLKQLWVWFEAGKIKCYETLSRSGILSYKTGSLNRINGVCTERWLDGRSFCSGGWAQ